MRFVLLAMLALASPQPAFDVASVKRAGEVTVLNPAQEPIYDPRSGRFNCTDSLRAILQMAWQLHRWEISGPDWIESERYTITAIAPPHTLRPTSNLMLRKLLEDRFRLRSHFEDRPLEIYALLRGKGKLKLTPAKAGAIEYYDYTLGHFRGVASVSAFASVLGGFVGHTVVDKTGYTGLYVFDVNWAKDIPGYTPAEGHTTYLRAAASLGLKLDPRKASAPILVVDSIEKEPTPN